MKWTKIKPQHYISGNLSLDECGAMVRLICLTASIERMPTPRETRMQVPQATYSRLISKLQALDTTLIDVLDKVLEDVENIENKKQISRDTSRRYRKKTEEKSSDNEGSSDVSSDTTDKIRLDKIRLDKNKQLQQESWFCEVWDLYPAPRHGRKEALRHFKTTVKTVIAFERIMRAVKNYRTCDTVTRGFVKNGATWFNNWEEYVDEQLTVGDEIKIKKQQEQVNSKLKAMGLV